MKPLATIAIALILLFSLFILNPFPSPHLVAHSNQSSIRILSADGTLLRDTLSAAGGRRQPVLLKEVSPDFIKLLLATEDRWFFFHPGINVLSIGRALWQNWRQGSVVSGGSTITMQLIRSLSHGPRTMRNKLYEMAIALWTEMALSKEKILELYLNVMPFGNEIYGVAEASNSYFHKTPKDLSLAESALLLGIIRAPSFYNPYTNHVGIKALRDRILRKYEAKNVNISTSVLRALEEKTVVYPLRRRFLTPHFADFVLSQIQNSSQRHGQGVLPRSIRTSLDLALQAQVEAIVAGQLLDLKDRLVSEASVLVVNNETAQILAYVGSGDYWNNEFQGMVDGVRQSRQPGSSLKTFLYARALDVGVPPNHVLPDVGQVFSSEVGDYIPDNYDRRFRGPVLMRTALANSLNVPAVTLLSEIGVGELYGTLQKLSFSRLTQDPAYYGLGLTLGNVEVSLFELVRAYSVFGRRGLFCDLSFLALDKPQACHPVFDEPVFSEVALQVVRDFLSDRHARAAVFGVAGPLDFDFPVMIKTGTSQDYRDNWTVAVTPEYTVGVWVGNFNGDAMQGVSGVTGAAPIAHKVVTTLFDKTPWNAWGNPVTLSKQKVCPISGKQATALCPLVREEFVTNPGFLAPCDAHVETAVDERNGLLAGPDCPAEVVQKRRFVKLPSVFWEWQQQSMGQKMAPQVFSPLCGDREEAIATDMDNVATGIKILSPRHDAIYKIDVFRPAVAQYLVLQTSAPQELFDLYFDGQKIVAEDFSGLSLARGRHTVALVRVGGALEKDVVDEVAYWVK